MRKLCCVLVLAALGAGCASYEYDIVRPQGGPNHAPGGADVVLHGAEADYALRSYDSRLVMRIQNKGKENLELLGEKSTVVDPKGQSHPLRGVTIAPDSFAKVILPPMPPRVERVGPSIGFGVGTSFGDARRRRAYGGGFSQDLLDGDPQYFAIYDDETYFWDWSGESNVRLTLVLKRGDTVSSEEFEFHRVKK